MGYGRKLWAMGHMTHITHRPYLTADAESCVEIFRVSVRQSAASHYDQDQREAWASTIGDESALLRRFDGAAVLISEIGGEIVGFGSLKNTGKIDMVYVHPNFGRRGVASRLIGALSDFAKSKSTKVLTVDASDVSRPLFGRLGFVEDRRGFFSLGEIRLAYTAMVKTL
jgi:putative acetyltransferase